MDSLENKVKELLAKAYEKIGDKIGYLSRTANAPVYTGFQLAEEIRNET